MQEHQKIRAPRSRRRKPLGADILSSISAEAGSGYRLTRGAPHDGDAVLEGRFLINNLGVALQIHASDALEMESARARILLPPSLTVSLVLHGEIDATLDDIPLALSARDGPSGRLWCHNRPVHLERRIRSGQRVRKVNVSVPIDAVAQLCREEGESPVGERLAGLLATRDLALLGWSPTRQSIRSAEQILAPDDGDEVLGRLTLGICALTLVRDALSRIAEPVLPASVGPAAPRDAARAHLARQYIVERLAADLRLADIARHTAMSVSTLQRVFKSCFGVTVHEFVRVKRLERAREALRRGSMTISEAAYRAGYSSGANFATAFRNEFGHPPSHCLQGSGKPE